MNILVLILSLLLLLGARERPLLRRSEGGMIRLKNPHRAQICQFELFELILLTKSDKQLPVEQFEAAVSQSAVPSPPLSGTAVCGIDTVHMK